MSGTRENTYTFLVSSADPDDTPVWVDLTDRVREDEEPMVALTGRQNDLDEAEPGRFQTQLDNDDDAFSYGSSASPYAAWWGPGRKCQLRETVAGQELNMWTGYLETPTEQLVTATEDGVGDRKRVSITAVDRLGRLENSEPFVSTLAAHIVYAGNTLSYYWPLVDQTAPFRPLVGSAYLAGIISPVAGRTLETQAAVVPAAGAQLPGDDMPGCSLVMGQNQSASADSPLLAVGALQFGGLAVPGGLGAIADQVVLWVSPQLPFNEVVTLLTYSLSWGASKHATITLTRLVAASNGVFQLDVTGDVTGSITSTVTMGTDRYFMIGVQVTLGVVATTINLSIDDQVFTTSGSGAGLITGQVCDYIKVGGKLQGSVAHLQMYTGALTTTQFAAQRQVGLTGLARQATGGRILTVAGYAGVPTAELTQVDAGQAVMQMAALAGKNPLAAMREAEAVERGLLYVDGSGRLVFKDRRTLYNV